MEVSFHLTGKYPDWWEGRRFSTPVRCFVGGPNSEHVRDNAQKLLFGPPEEEGTGTIPADKIKRIERSRGIKNAIDYALVQHSTGGLSFLKFKSYDQETDAWSGDTLHFVWYDEEPPIDKYSEGLTRTNAGDAGKPGMIFLTITPLLGMTQVARKFHPRPQEEDAYLVRMGLKDALHYRPEDIKLLTKQYPEHERKARVEGIPQLGEGAVFPIERDHYVVDPPDRQDWWLYLGAIDFGWDHPCGAVEGSWCRDTDTIVIYRNFRRSRAKTSEIASALRRWGEWLPWAWPHDGYVHDRQSGQTVCELFREEGLDMLPIHAQYEDGSAGLEASVLEMNNRLAERRLLVCRSCVELLDEMDTYHREKGRVVKEFDDVISAVRYLIMMRRYGRLMGGRVLVPKVVGGASYRPFG
jgi:phage terminase large subunit-like protein